MNINHAIRYIIFLFICVSAGMLSVGTTHAQFMPPPTSATLEITPRHPEPGSTYTVAINAPSLTLSGMEIEWQTDGVARPEFGRSREITLTAPALGIPTTITALLTAGNKAPTRLDATMAPGTVDIVIEGDTVTPHFYEGRPVPSTGSGVRIIAIPHLFSAQGTPLAPDTLSYRWSINDKLVHGGKGASVVTTEIPRLGDAFLTLAIENESGTVTHTSIIEIPTITPLVRFYEEHPLYGLARNAIKNRFALSGDEVTIKAEPYFVSTNIFDNAQYAWTLNRASVENPSDDPRYITLRRVGAGGESEVGFSIRNLAALTQYAVGLFTVDFQNEGNNFTLP